MPSAVDESVETHRLDGDRKWSLQPLIRHAEHSHSRMPGIRRIPLRAIGIILFIAFLNMVVWIAAAIVLVIGVYRCSSLYTWFETCIRCRPHICIYALPAIDLMTRRLLATGQRPVTVGTFFSLGHSTIVIITSIVVAATAAAVSSRFGSFSTIGGIIGSSVSAVFLILLGLMNGYILYKLIKQMQKVFSLPMYPLGILFGLGFDTSSEIALLGISSIEAAKGTSFWVILILPALFTAGMCLLDTTDGALMFSLYIQPSANFLPPKPPNTTSDATSTTSDGEELPQSHDNHRDPIAFLYYSIVLTSLTVMVAIVIGVIQLLTMILNVTHAKGKFWDGVQTAGDYYDVIGGSICGCFIIFGGFSVLLYKPWRRWMTRRHGRSVVIDEEEYRDDALGGGEPVCEVFDGSSEEEQQCPTETAGKGTVSQVAVKPTGEPRLEDEIV
ncbi:hypothetical protein N7510_008332 [Penicillium lagena]|uniref:uncharacterized protein n=1 Tax=Penicillium lagena TaxID=94218 RepID=UPI00254021B8|nr:uncharacterized protein N7510_008332 [Penicillium lagena]KAJ5605551.1 hypothetical protein N7510_008332 [Penicillium lagena]